MMSDVIFHIDVNSAYLSWTSAHMLESGETLDLRAIPSIIGGDEKAAAVSYWRNRFRQKHSAS